MTHEITFHPHPFWCDDCGEKSAFRIKGCAINHDDLCPRHGEDAEAIFDSAVKYVQSVRSYKMTDKTALVKRDYTDVVRKLAAKVREFCYIHNFNYDHMSLPDRKIRAEILESLQEFDAQNPPNVSGNGASDHIGSSEHSECCYGCAYELDMLIEDAFDACRNEDWDSFVRRVKKNHPRQWEKYMGKADSAEIAQSEEPKPNFSGCTFSNTGGIKLTGNTPVWNITPPDPIIGNEYEYKCGKFSKKWFRGKLISFTERQAVLQNDQGYKVLQRNCTEIRAYVPEPVEHKIGFRVHVWRHPTTGDYSLTLRHGTGFNDEIKTPYTIGDLYFTRTFTEGEGL